MPIVAKLDELGRPAWIALVILGFIAWWPAGLAILASDNPGCLMHIGGGARNRGQELRVAHVLELVAERLAR